MTSSTDFASTLTELEKVVLDLDSDIPIEKALALFEKGMQLSNECEKFLSAAQQKVEILKRANATNELVVESFAVSSVSEIMQTLDQQNSSDELL